LQGKCFDRDVKNRKPNEWIWPPADQLITMLGFWVALIGFFGARLFWFFSRLTGTRWIWCYVTALAIASIGASMIFFGKLPLYRERRFFTFGSGALPEQRRPIYRWGYRSVVFAVALLVCLLLSRV
jgi:hypothetical protein